MPDLKSCLLETKIDWKDPAVLDVLGTLPDVEVAAKLGVSPARISQVRKALHIKLTNPGKRNNWAPDSVEGESMVLTSFRIRKVDHDRLKALATREGMTASLIIRDIIKLGLDAYETEPK